MLTAKNTNRFIYNRSSTKCFRIIDWIGEYLFSFNFLSVRVFALFQSLNLADVTASTDLSTKKQDIFPSLIYVIWASPTDWEVKYCISKFPEEKVFRSLNKQVAFEFWCERVKECSILDGFTKTQNLWTEPTWQLPQISTQKNKIFRILTLLNFPTLSVRWAS